MIDFPTFSQALTSPIWFLALAVFGTIYYFQWVFGQLENAPRNVKCHRCENVLAHYFPNTKFCMDCYHILRQEMDQLTAQLEAGRKQVAEATDAAGKLAGYNQAIDACERLRVMYRENHKAGLPLINNIDDILEHAYKERSEITGEAPPTFIPLE